MRPRTSPAALLAVFLVTVIVAALAVLLLSRPAGAAALRWQPPPDTIVAVEGNAADGFTVFHYDGSTLSPPTDSEAAAECGEYDTRVQRVRCRTEVRVWYRDLADLRRALRFAETYGPYAD